MNRNLIKLGFAALAATGLVGVAAAKPTLSTPTITCGSSTQASITIHVCAGATGAPAGFSVQWVKASDLAANFGIWPATDGTSTGCGASFSGNANLSRYNLPAFGCVDVNIGELLFDEGASTVCPNALDCGTEYVFRAFAHATNSANRSNFTANLSCFTLTCGPACFDPAPGGQSNCTMTQGFWKTHGPVGCLTGNNTNFWPGYVDDVSPFMTLGTVTYSASQICTILNTAAAGNGLTVLAHQLIAAKMNIAHGADGTAAAQCIADADALIGALVVPSVGTGSLSAGATSTLTSCLTNYNEGASGPGHCSGICPPPPPPPAGGNGK